MHCRGLMPTALPMGSAGAGGACSPVAYITLSCGCTVFVFAFVAAPNLFASAAFVSSKTIEVAVPLSLLLRMALTQLDLFRHPGCEVPIPSPTHCVVSCGSDAITSSPPGEHSATPFAEDTSSMGQRSPSTKIASHSKTSLAGEGSLLVFCALFIAPPPQQRRSWGAYRCLLQSLPQPTLSPLVLATQLAQRLVQR